MPPQNERGIGLTTREIGNDFIEGAKNWELGVLLAGEWEHVETAANASPNGPLFHQAMDNAAKRIDTFWISRKNEYDAWIATATAHDPHVRLDRPNGETVSSPLLSSSEIPAEINYLYVDRQGDSSVQSIFTRKYGEDGSRQHGVVVTCQPNDGEHSYIRYELTFTDHKMTFQRRTAFKPNEQSQTSRDERTFEKLG